MADTTPTPSTSAGLRILAEPQADPAMFRFRLDRVIFPGDSWNAMSAADAAGSPLLEELFALGGIAQVRVAEDAVTVLKSGDAPWSELARRVGAVLRKHLAGGGRFEVPARSRPAQSDSRTFEERVREILRTQVNPGVAGHGGNIELVEARGKDIYLRMSGGCQGCSSAQLTLRQGIERALRAQIPELGQVHDVTDHSSGKNPYFL